MLVQRLEMLLCLNGQLSLQGLDLKCLLLDLIVFQQALVLCLLQFGLLLALLGVEFADEGTTAFELHLVLLLRSLNHLLVIANNLLKDLLPLHVPGHL